MASKAVKSRARRATKLAIATVLFAICATAAIAQSPQDKWEAFAEGGASISLDHFNDASIAFGNPPTAQTVRNTTHVPASGRLFTGFRFWFEKRDALEISYSYAPSDIVETSFCESVNCGNTILVSIARANFFSANYVRSFPMHRLQLFLAGE